MEQFDLKNDPFLEKLVALFIREYQPVKIYLFGSKARGDDTTFSDYDIMIVVPDATPGSVKQPGRAHRLMWKAGLTEAVDILVWTKSRFESCIHLKASLPAAVVEEGKLLYAA